MITFRVVPSENWKRVFLPCDRLFTPVTIRISKYDRPCCVDKLGFSLET